MTEKKETLHIYTRVSTDAQEEKGTSLEYQRELGIKAAKRLGMKHQVWNEGGQSSYHADFSNRPVLSKLLEKIEAGEVKHLWVYNNDRLSRNETTAHKIRITLRNNGVTFYTLTGKFNLNNPQDNLMKKMFDGFAEYENDTRAERTSRGKIRKVKEGYWKGGPPPFGYEIKDKKLVRHPEESKWVEQIYAWYQARVSIEEIKNMLDKNNVKPRHNKNTWTLGSIQNILKNTHPIGYYTYTDKKLGETVKSECPEIVSITLWNRCQEIRKETWVRKGQNNRTKRFYLLRNFLYCGHCGSVMAGRVIPSKNENFYYCPRKERNWVKSAPKGKDKWLRGKGCSMVRSLNIAQTDKLILDTVQQTQIDSNFYQHIAKAVYDGRKRDLEKKGVTLIQEYQTAKARAERELANAIENIADATATQILKQQDPKVAKIVLGKLESTKKYLEQKIEQLNFKIEEMANQEKVFNWFEEFKKDVTLPANSTDLEKYSYLSGLIKRIDVHYDPTLSEHKLNIHFMIPLVNRPEGEKKSPFEYKDMTVILKKNQKRA